MTLALLDIQEIRYKLQMMDLIIEPTYFILRDNQVVVYNTQFPTSITLKKKHNAVAFHKIKETMLQALSAQHTGRVRTKIMIFSPNQRDHCITTFSQVTPIWRIPLT
jgi:hypothetical protein